MNKINMPLRNERQFSYLSYENLCLKIFAVAWYTINIISIPGLRTMWLYYGYGYGTINIFRYID